MARQSARSERPRASSRTEDSLRQPFFDKAFELLADQGNRGLKLTPLCRALGVTTGAFYYCFDDWQDFVVALLDHWLAERTTLLVGSAMLRLDPVARLEYLLGAVRELPHRAEADIRAWASWDPYVARVQERVDAERHRVVVDAFTHIVADRGLASRYADAGVALLIGFEQRIVDDDDADALAWSLRLLLDSARAATSD